VKKAAWIAGLLWLCTIAWLHQIERSDFFTLWVVFTFSFAAYAWLLFSKYRIDLKTGLLLALGARILSLFFEPLLSDDYYRFIWDGMVSQSGVHPMAFTPQHLMEHPGTATTDPYLFSMLNSKEYYSVYPPVSQWLFSLSYWMNALHIRGHILFYKSILIAADLLIVFLLSGLLKRKGLPEKNVLWYALNPLIILEFTGNLHMDNLMIAGLLGSVWLSDKRSMIWSSAFMIFSISSKMLTLILIPFMPIGMYWRKMIVFATGTIAGVLLVFVSYFGQLNGWMESVSLWFGRFEFNAGLYYLVRAAGYWLKGYNTIETTAPVMALITVLIIGLIWPGYMHSKIKDWAFAMLLVVTVYFLMGTTIHPWYLGLVLTLGVLSHRYYPLVWTYLALLSYSHYASGRFQENYMLITIEYVLLFTWILLEWQWRKKNREALPPSLIDWNGP
jgi:hypothetical protein